MSPGARGSSSWALVAGWRKTVPPQLPGVPSRHSPRHAGVPAVNSQAAAGKALSPQAGTARLRAGTAALAGAASTACVSVPVCTREENTFPLGNELQSGLGPEGCAVPPSGTLGAGGWHPHSGPFCSPGGASCSLAPGSAPELWAGGRTGMEPASTLRHPRPRSVAGGGLQTLLSLRAETSLAQHPLSITAPMAAALLNPPQHPAGNVGCPTGVW